MKALKRILVAVGNPKPTALLIVYVKHVIASMTGNASFTAPNPTLSVMSADVNALDAAETLVKSRAPGAAAARTAKQATLIIDLRTLKAYVQTIADAAGPETAQSIIESAGMSIRPFVSAPKPPLSAKMGKSSGNVNLRAKAVARKAAYEWSYSADGAKTWIAMPVTDVAHTSISGLAAGTTYQFKVRGTVKGVTGDWSQIVSLLVH